MYLLIMEEFLYGWCGGILGTIISHPVDTIRVNFQSGIRPHYSIRSLYKGIVAPLIGIGMEKAVVFGSYHFLHEQLSKFSLFHRHKNMNNFVSGVGSGVVSTAVVTPVEYFKILCQNSNKITLDKLSMKRLYCGWTATLFREVPGYGIYFYTYNTLTDTFGKNPLSIFFSGGMAGITAWLGIYPADYIKTRMQYYQTPFYTTTKHILSNDGIIGMYKGCSLALIRAFVLHCSVFLGYEYSKSLWA